MSLNLALKCLKFFAELFTAFDTMKCLVNQPFFSELVTSGKIAGVAQLVEQLICNQPVASSSLVTSFLSKSILSQSPQGFYPLRGLLFELIEDRNVVQSKSKILEIGYS